MSHGMESINLDSQSPLKLQGQDISKELSVIKVISVYTQYMFVFLFNFGSLKPFSSLNSKSVMSTGSLVNEI